MSPADFDRAELLRSLGTKELNASLSETLEQCLQELCDAMQPRVLWRLLALEQSGEGVRLGGLALQGKDIALHLQGCRQAVLLAVTLSASVDALIRRAEYQDMTRAVMLDAAAGAAIEILCDRLEQELRETLGFPYLTARFSAGYGDFPISQQGELIRLLDATRKIGLTVTPQQTLLPLKSVTAILGLSHQPVQDARRFGCGFSCAVCPQREDCPRRRVSP